MAVSFMDELAFLSVVRGPVIASSRPGPRLLYPKHCFPGPLPNKKSYLFSQGTVRLELEGLSAWETGSSPRSPTGSRSNPAVGRRTHVEIATSLHRRPAHCQAPRGWSAHRRAESDPFP